MSSFVPDDFVVPPPLDLGEVHFEPLDAHHNQRDHRAWMSSIDHIKATPGFAGLDWPAEMSLEANLGDLIAHADDCLARRGFTYSILERDSAASSSSADVVGCLYIYPPRTARYDAHVRSWVIEARAELDKVIWAAVSDWLLQSWPFANPEYAPRP